MDRIPWDEYWLNMCYFVAMRSIDPRTHVGAVCVSEANTVLSVGYNGFCRGSDDTRVERMEGENKYLWIEHAERNALYAAARAGIVLFGSSMYTIAVPCADCARGIVQSGIKRVIVDASTKQSLSEKWKKHQEATTAIFNETGVSLLEYQRQSPLIKIHGLLDGHLI